MHPLPGSRATGSPPAGLGAAVPAPWAQWRAGGRDQLWFWAFSHFKFTPFLHQCQAAQVGAIGAEAHFYVRREALFTQKEQARAPVTSLLVLSNTLLYQSGAKMPLLGFFGGAGRKHKG